LRALQRVNRSVRQEEVEALADEREALDRALAGSRIRLDSVQLIDRGPRR
jgi:ATP-dependent helicase HepA